MHATSSPSLVLPTLPSPDVKHSCFSFYDIKNQRYNMRLDPIHDHFYLTVYWLYQLQDHAFMNDVNDDLAARSGLHHYEALRTYLENTQHTNPRSFWNYLRRTVCRHFGIDDVIHGQYLVYWNNATPFFINIEHNQGNRADGLRWMQQLCYAYLHISKPEREQFHTFLSNGLLHPWHDYQGYEQPDTYLWEQYQLYAKIGSFNPNEDIGHSETPIYLSS